MGLVELFRLLFSEDEEIVIPINDDEIGKPTYVEHTIETDTCHLSNYESENMTELKELVEKLSSTPEGPAPRFKLESNEI